MNITKQMLNRHVLLATSWNHIKQSVYIFNSHSLDTAPLDWLVLQVKAYPVLHKILFKSISITNYNYKLHFQIVFQILFSITLEK